jgi:hypothetical protein
MGVPVLISDHSTENNCNKTPNGSKLQGLASKNLSFSSRKRRYSWIALD